MCLHMHLRCISVLILPEVMVIDMCFMDTDGNSTPPFSRVWMVEACDWSG